MYINASKRTKTISIDKQTIIQADGTHSQCNAIMQIHCTWMLKKYSLTQQKQCFWSIELSGTWKKSLSCYQDLSQSHQQRHWIAPWTPGISLKTTQSNSQSSHISLAAKNIVETTYKVIREHCFWYSLDVYETYMYA
jgi:hypothetical protein